MATSNLGGVVGTEWHYIVWDDVGTAHGVYHGLSRVDPDMEMDIGL